MKKVINFIGVPKEVPLRVDFAGGWLDVPKYSRAGGFIVNCAIEPLVSLTNWVYKKSSGLGGSAAYAVLMGEDGIQSELDLGVGWQDPAIIRETGLCVWVSGDRPKLYLKRDPYFLKNKMALLWTGNTHITYEKTDLARDYDLILKAGAVAKNAVAGESYEDLCVAVNLSYEVQMKEGMQPLSGAGETAKKYCGGGWGGYALYMFKGEKERNNFLKLKGDRALKIEPVLL
jgi:hypothetical protein